MNLAKYLAVLDTSTLYFARPDQFDDRAEGHHPEANVQLRGEIISRFGEDSTEGREAAQLLASPAQILEARKRVAINCWHQSPTESPALWNAYGSPLGVAVETSTDRLIDALDSESRPVYIGLVRYVNYERVLIDFDQWAPFLCKQPGFAHEREVRLLVDGGSTDRADAGVAVAVNLDRLVRIVYVNPSAPGWFLDVVRRATARLGITAEVRQSSLAGAPTALRLPGTEAATLAAQSIAYRVSVLMGEDMSASWANLLIGYLEGEVVPNLVTIARTGANPRPMIETVVTMMENSIAQIRTDIRNQLLTDPEP